MADATNSHTSTHLWTVAFTGPGTLHIENRDKQWPVFYSMQVSGATLAPTDEGHQLLASEIRPIIIPAGFELQVRNTRPTVGATQDLRVTNAV